jgi:hypothetical protein
VTAAITRGRVVEAIRPGMTLGALFEEFGLTWLDLPGRACVVQILAELKQEGHLRLVPPREETDR